MCLDLSADPTQRAIVGLSTDVAGGLFGVGPQPLVVEIHGGPHTLYGWAPFWEFQILAAAGVQLGRTYPEPIDRKSVV